jgi:ComF family protein
MTSDTADLSARPPSGQRLGTAARAAGRALTDLILPPQCLACDRGVGGDGGLCPSCWSALRLIERPYCERLGTPFPYDMGAGAESAEAIAEPPPFRRCRAVAAYDDVARRLVHGLKYRDRLELAGRMGAWMARAGAELVGDADLVVPVPMHRWRLWSRRFNQSASLAAAVAATGGKPLSTAALVRVKATRQQVGLTAAERDRNVRGAFRVPDGERLAVAGRSILLVDDVFTTGATVKAATRALVRARAAAVDVLVFARVVRGPV